VQLQILTGLTGRHFLALTASHVIVLATEIFSPEKRPSQIDLAATEKENSPEGQAFSLVHVP
jgi:hypothetical protein